MAELMGTAFLVQGTWYLRYVGGGGAMIPIEAGAEAKASLKDGAMVSLQGSILSDHRGCARSAHATKAEIIGQPDL
jgi:hypothetical protein